MISAQELIERKNSIKKIFFYRICGTGMGACACLLKEQGYEVEGADLSFGPPMDAYLRKSGIALYDLKEVDSQFLQKYDLIVVGNSVPRVSEHAQLIEECSVAFTSFPTILGSFVLNKQNVIGVAGTHGKTTTTYFLTQMLEKLGKKPGYLIGGIMDGRPPSRLGDGSYFVIESDEYDSAYFQKYSKFRQYEIDHLILTSLEFDHADIFNDISDIENEFIEGIKTINSTFIFNNDYPSCLKLHDLFKSKGVWFLYGETSPIGPVDMKSTNTGSTFGLNLDGNITIFETNIIGKHNILNLTACILFCLNEGFSVDEIKKSLKELKLVKRRQELRGKYRGVNVIDDFAHHPRAVSLTIEAIKQTYENKIVVVFDPVSATARSNLFQNEFLESLSGANKVITCEPQIKTTAQNRENLDTLFIVNELNKKGIESVNVSSLEQLREKIDSFIDEESTLLILSNRNALGLWQSAFIDEIH